MPDHLKYLIYAFAALMLIAACSGRQCGAERRCDGTKAVIAVSSEYVGGNFDKVKERYCESVRLAGGVPVILPRVSSKKQAVELLDLVDGLIIIGGDDVNPRRYGEEVLNESVQWNDAQDSSDFFIIGEAVSREMPILGICRGMQAVNVALGGTLWQDIPTQIGDSLAHRQQEPTIQPTHTVRLEPDSRFAKILGRTAFDTNSHHHQAVKETAPGLRAVGFTEDGVVEAAEGDNIMLIQSHPENLVTAGRTELMPLFTYLVSCASNQKEI